METLFLPTVDCDHVRGSSVELRQQTFDALLEVFADVGAAGHTTWFLNETYYDFGTTANHPAVVSEAVRRGDTVGVHDHIDNLDGRWELEPILDICTASRDSVRTWLRAQGHPDDVRAHRFGCLFQHPAAYAALARLGYTIASDVYPGDRSRNHTGHPSYDNVRLPLGISPYRHDADNFLDYQSRTGQFLQLPVTQMYFRKLTYEKVEQCMRPAEERQEPLAVLVLCFHPYELLDDERSALSSDRVEELRELFKGLTERSQVCFASAEECAAKWLAYAASGAGTRAQS